MLLSRIVKAWPIWLSVLVFAICAYVGFYFEEFTDIAFLTALSGTFMGGKANSFFHNYMYYTGISYVTKWLFNNFPSIPWWSYLMLLSLLLSTVSSLMLLRDISSFISGKKRWAFLIVVVSAWLIFLAEHLILVQFTKVSLLLAGIPMVHWLLIKLNSDKLQYPKWFFWYYNVLIIFAVMYRLETVTLLFGLVAVFLLVRPSFKWKSVLVYLKWFWPSIAVTLVIWGLFNVELTPTDERYVEIRAYSNTLWDFGQTPTGLNLDTEEDSVKYFALVDFFLNDPDNLNGDLLAELNVIALDKTPSDFLKYFDDWEYRKQKFGDFYTHFIGRKHPFYGQMFLLTLTLFVGFLLVMVKHSLLLRWFVFQVGFWLMLSGIAVMMKMEDRLFQPMLLINVLFSLTFLSSIFPSISLKNKKFVFSTFGMFLLILGPVLVRNTSFWAEKAQKRIRAANYATAAKADIDQRFSGKKIFWNMWAWNLVYPTVLDGTGFVNTTNQHFCIDNGETFLYPNYGEYMKEHFGTDSSVEILKQIKSGPEEVVFLSSPIRMELLTNYFRVVYDLKLETEIIPAPILDDHQHSYLNWEGNFGFHYYKLK